MVRAVLSKPLTLIVCALTLAAVLFTCSTLAVFTVTYVSMAERPAAGRPVAWTESPAEIQYPAGWWQRYANPADGYSLALPPEWAVIPLNDDPATAEQQAGAEESPLVAQLASWARERAADGMGVWAAAASDGTLGNATTFNIIRQPLGRDMQVEEFAQANLEALRKSDTVVGAIQERWLDLPVGRALQTRATYRLPIDGDGEAELAVTQLYLVRGANGYVLTGVTRPERVQENAPVIDGIAASLQWTEPAEALAPAQAAVPGLLHASGSAGWQ